MKVGFITTVDTNIGDDFIRQGIINILNATYQDRKLEYVCVNKHHPFTAYPLWHPLRHAPKFKKIRRGLRFQNYVRRLLTKLGGSEFDSCSLIIQSGAPVLWPSCDKCEWNIPIWQEIVGRLHEKIPVFNIAAGSCYPWENQPNELTSAPERRYAAMIGGFCKLTTTRDTLAASLFANVGIHNTLLPCTAFFVDDHFSNDHPGEYILINYMTGGGHFDWGQNIDKAKWGRTIRELIDHLRINHEVRFICHDDKEAALAKQLDPTLTVHVPKTVAEYLECIRRAKLGINNRMHASVAMGSVGVPAISVCTDTRLLMLKNIQMPISYVKEIDSAQLIAMAEHLLRNAANERERLFSLKKKSFAEYSQLFKRNFN